MAVEAKWVRVESYGGTIINFQGQTGIIRAIPLRVENIKKLLERGAHVWELVTEGEPIKLTLEDYDTDNSSLHAVEVDPETILAPDDDQLAKDRLEAMQEAKLAAIGEKFKAYFEQVYAEPTAVSVVKPLTMTFNKGTNISVLEDALPEEVSVNMSDGTTLTVMVAWTTDVVSTNNIGMISISGDLLFDNEEQNPSNIKATIDVNIVEAPPSSGDGISVNPLPGPNEEE